MDHHPWVLGRTGGPRWRNSSGGLFVRGDNHWIDIPTDQYQERFNQTLRISLVVGGHPVVDYQLIDCLDDERRPFVSEQLQD